GGRGGGGGDRGGPRARRERGELEAKAPGALTEGAQRRHQPVRGHTRLPLGKGQEQVAVLDHDGGGGLDTAIARRRHDPRELVGGPAGGDAEQVSGHPYTPLLEPPERVGGVGGACPPTASPFRFAQSGLRVPTCAGSELP